MSHKQTTIHPHGFGAFNASYVLATMIHKDDHMYLSLKSPIVLENKTSMIILLFE